MESAHRPVLLEETIEYLQCQQDGIYIDGTIGRGGHTEVIFDKIENQGMVIGIDRDIEAIEAVKERFSGYKNIKIVHGNYIDIQQILTDLKIDKVNGMIFDLGVSSPQFDNPERGFSYRYEAPLDMRMNRKQSLTAGDIVNQYSQRELTRIIKEYGEERWASRIASFIVDFRTRKPLETTYDLVEVIKAAIPASARRSGGHPARRTFQALRIATNNELEQLKELIQKAVPLLKSGGRICIISFHSLEDRIVKRSFRAMSNDNLIKLITKKPIMVSKKEIKANPRARSARLRVAEKF
jgi:16S rRNA (cytosine1402-N4)-methyltransferase